MIESITEKLGGSKKHRPSTAHHKAQSMTGAQLERTMSHKRPFSGHSRKSMHKRVKSAVTGGRKQIAGTQSVKEYVQLASDPRSGIWAMKSYKTPVAFHVEGQKI